jgi:hypothetical protein
MKACTYCKATWFVCHVCGTAVANEVTRYEFHEGSCPQCDVRVFAGCSGLAPKPKPRATLVAWLQNALAGR